MFTTKKSDVEKMQAYLLSKQPVKTGKALDKKVAYGPKPARKTNGKKVRKST